jgi:transposase-like protein
MEIEAKIDEIDEVYGLVSINFKCPICNSYTILDLKYENGITHPKKFKCYSCKEEYNARIEKEEGTFTPIVEGEGKRLTDEFYNRVKREMARQQVG